MKKRILVGLLALALCIGALFAGYFFMTRNPTKHYILGGESRIDSPPFFMCNFYRIVNATMPMTRARLTAVARRR